MSLYVGVIRNEDGLRKAAGVFDKIKENKISNLCLEDERSIRRVAGILEVGNLLIIGQLVTLAATLRRETRGEHNREDYPELDERWSKNIVLQLEGKQTTVKMNPVVQAE